jgi:predicted TIM-barrel fold metal-dependent hydrolase
MTESIGESATVIDFGAHFFPGKPPEDQKGHDFIEAQQGAALHRNIADLKDRYSDAGIDGVTLSQEDIVGSSHYEQVREENNAMLNVGSDHDNVYTLAAVPTEAGGEKAAAELKRCINAGHNGGVIQTRSGGIELYHDEIDPVLQVANEMKTPLLVHPKVHDSLHPDVLDDKWRLNSLFGREIAVCESIVKVVNSGVLDKYPDLNLVFHHLGGNIASFFGRICGDTGPSRAPETGKFKPYDEFREQVEERIYLDTSGFYGDLAAFRATLEVFPPSNVLFGTDFPYETRTPEDFHNIISTIEELCPRTETRDILGQNALDLLVNT